ncbi:MAG: transglutaminase family protein [Alphaproteobacteria bacterium]|nr:transglutaminase family protein [Alphaproteobacteria bacterium]MBV9692212.1 transglutaminase family protein [Alphaproteobacteria bacterium]
MRESENARDYLEALGRSGEAPFDIAEAALLLASLDHPGLPLEPFRAHLDELAGAVRTEQALMRSIDEAARALANIFCGHFGYDGDRVTYNDERNADLISVIERRRGMPVALGILYMHAARAAQLPASGLDAPGHFLVLLARGSAERTIDVFNGGAMLDSECAASPPRMGAPGDPHLAQPVSDADVLLRLQNNLKLRALQRHDQVRGLEIAKRMVLIGPRRPELWLDLARLNEAQGVLRDARKAYESCLTLAAPGQSVHNEAALALSGLKRRIN